MAQYTAKDLKNISKAELVDLLKKEGIEFDPAMPYFTMRALLLNKDENKNEESMKKTEKNEVENIEQTKNIEQIVEQTENIEQTVEQTENVEVNIEETTVPADKEVEVEIKKEVVDEQPEVKKDVKKPSLLSTLRSELVKRKGGKGLGKSAFAAELAKRKGERVSGVTFAQELKSRQLKYGNK